MSRWKQNEDDTKWSKLSVDFNIQYLAVHIHSKGKGCCNLESYISDCVHMLFFNAQYNLCTVLWEMHIKIISGSYCY